MGKSDNKDGITIKTFIYKFLFGFIIPEDANKIKDISEYKESINNIQHLQDTLKIFENNFKNILTYYYPLFHVKGNNNCFDFLILYDNLSTEDGKILQTVIGSFSTRVEFFIWMKKYMGDNWIITGTEDNPIIFHEKYMKPKDD